MLTRLLTSVTILFYCALAHASELPRSGDDAYTTTYVTTSFNTIKQGERTITNYDVSGVTRNDAGGPMFNNMGTRCLGMREGTGSESVNRGSCIDTDSDGDQIFSTYEAKGSIGHHVFIGGTGKYKGITGTADYVNNPIKTSDGRGMNITPHRSTWKLP